MGNRGKNANLYSNLQCFAASLPIRLPKAHLQSLCPKEKFVRSAPGAGRWHGAGNSNDEDQDGVDTPASDPVLVWRPTLWSAERLTPVLRQSRPMPAILSRSLAL